MSAPAIRMQHPSAAKVDCVDSVVGCCTSLSGAFGLRQDIAQPTRPTPSPTTSPGVGLEPLSSLLARRHANITVAARPLSDYETAIKTTPNGANR